MGRAGWGLFDSDQAWDAVSDLSPLAGIALDMIDWPKEDWEEGDLPIMTTEDARAHLNNGHFDSVFGFLKERRDCHDLLLFVGVSMRIGVCISKAQLRYAKQICKEADPMHLFHFDKQIEYAVREYKCGEPYYLRDFDEDGTLLPNFRAKKGDSSASKTDADESTTEEKRDMPGKDDSKARGLDAKQPEVHSGNPVL